MEGIIKLYKNDNFRKSAEACNKAMEELRNELEANLLNGYQVFTQSLK